MALTGTGIRILQIHPTRLCNLRCTHCYSSSGPNARGFLPTPLLVEAIEDAAALGYNVLSISGGEPLLYPGLLGLCEAAKQHRMTVTLVTNGSLLDRSKVSLLSSYVDGLAISLDGAPERHDAVRRKAGAFATLAGCLPGLRESGIPFGFVYTLTRENLCDLEWAADFAVEQGARLLQVHPVEPQGRARNEVGMRSLPAEELSTAAVVVDCLRVIHAGRLTVQYDVASRSGYLEALRSVTEPGQTTAEIVSPLIIEDDAEVSPLRYGFPRAFTFGNLRNARLAALAATWDRAMRRDFVQLHEAVGDAVRRDPNGSGWVYPYELLAQAAEQPELRRFHPTQ